MVDWTPLLPSPDCRRFPANNHFPPERRWTPTNISTVSLSLSSLQQPPFSSVSFPPSSLCPSLVAPPPHPSACTCRRILAAAAPPQYSDAASSTPQLELIVVLLPETASPLHRATSVAVTKSDATPPRAPQTPATKTLSLITSNRRRHHRLHSSSQHPAISNEPPTTHTKTLLRSNQQSQQIIA
uniref:Uncharacterized protein n=1 Tax=Daucus carota subsp. sativus TaxID=79200 RepID=A0A162ALK0_DAUCS